MSELKVTVVVPGRNCADTVRECLGALLKIRSNALSRLAEIIFVDDGSTDETAKIVSDLEVTLVRGEGRGPGAARNLGWRAATTELIWFVDSDCLAEPDALDKLVPHLDQHSNVGGVGGSYGIANPESLLARLIHEEIVVRHSRMPETVNFLATFNVLYRREALDRIAGFDEQFLKGQDAELAFRMLEAGYKLRFEKESRVRHFHEDRFLQYLKVQRQQGYWRVFLHLRHAGHAKGDSYSSWLDHLQPPLAVATAGSVLLCWFPILRWTPLVCATALLMCQWPMTRAMMRQSGDLRMAAFAPMSVIRAFFRGIGMCQGVIACMTK